MAALKSIKAAAKAKAALAAGRSGLRHLDTRSFTQAIADYRTHIQTYERITTNVDNALGDLLDRWRGPGRDAFRSDISQACRCLEDIHQSMCAMRTTLEAAHTEYANTDRGIRDSFVG